MYKPQKAILQAFLNFANESEARIPKGGIIDEDGNPVVMINLDTGQALCHWREAYVEARKILEKVALGGPDEAIRYVNHNYPRMLLWVEDANRVIVPIPKFETAKDFASVALFLALTTPLRSSTGVDTLGDRIRRCHRCHRFFIQKTRRSANYCMDRCRWGDYNAKKKRPA